MTALVSISVWGSFDSQSQAVVTPGSKAAKNTSYISTGHIT